VLAAALAFAMLFPTAVAWLYFLVLARGAGQVNPWQQLTYAAGKCVQFAFPVAFLWAFEGRFPRPGRPRFAGLLPGLAFGLAVAALIFGLYFGLLRHSPLLAEAPARVRQKVQEFGVASAGSYALFSAFICLAHSLLEEYYWRWFVFGQLRRLLPLAPSLLLSALAFMAHHVLVLHAFFPGQFLGAVVPLSLAIATGGVVWAWLYERSGSVWSPWLSHLLVDAAIFGIGWEMLRP
jgi:membrane protease YdiL (CAAX protease family)